MKLMMQHKPGSRGYGFGRRCPSVDAKGGSYHESIGFPPGCRPDLPADSKMARSEADRDVSGIYNNRGESGFCVLVCEIGSRESQLLFSSADMGPVRSQERR